MRRQDIQLVANARQGDLIARCEVGRRYLLGIEGFPRHLVLGLEYLDHPSVAGSLKAAIIIAEALPLHHIVFHRQLRALQVAATGASSTAQFKLGVWLCLTSTDSIESRAWFENAASAGSAAARVALRAMNMSTGGSRIDVLRAVAAEPGIDCAALTTLALSNAFHAEQDHLLAQMMDCALCLRCDLDADLADTVCVVLERAQWFDDFPMATPSGRIEALLEDCVRRGNCEAALLLGRALCGLDAGPLGALSLTTGSNMRKGAALLLRAADGGKREAWMLLYRVHSDNRASVANPLMARFFLEKAATGGSVPAQRRLGALILRSARTLHESEQGIHWLYQAAQQQDMHAIELLRSLVLPVMGLETEAASGIDAIGQQDPWMACRLRTARDFGLTKQEALSVDIVTAVRPWGLVVGTNPFINQAKLSAPRAIPALTLEATQNLCRSANLFEQMHQGGPAMEGDLRKRSVRLRHLLERHRMDESLFVAKARSHTLSTLRQGTKWAFYARQPLRMALA